MVVDKKTYTYAEYSAFIDQPENEGRIFELIDGEIVEKMPSFAPSYISLRMATELNLYLRQNPIGRISGEAGGYILSEDDVLIPDVGYISKERMPEIPRREAPIAPDLAIEVKSPTDRKNKMRLKTEKYLALGTRIVWLIFPEDKVVEVYTQADTDGRIIGIDGVLDGGDVLPGFTLKVSDIFADI